MDFSPTHEPKFVTIKNITEAIRTDRITLPTFILRRNLLLTKTIIAMATTVKIMYCENQTKPSWSGKNDLATVLLIIKSEMYHQ